MEANRKEIHELYVLCRLLGQGMVNCGQADGTSGTPVPVAAVVRQESDGPHRYVVEGDVVNVPGPGRFMRAEFVAVADGLLELLSNSGDGLDISAFVPFLEKAGIREWSAFTQDRTHLHVAFWHPEAPLVGLRIQGRLCGYTPLLSGGRAANLKWEQTGVRFSHPAVLKINDCEDPGNVAEVARRMLYIESLGGVFKYADVCDRVFRSNLLMIDTNLPRILAAMLQVLHLDNVSRMSELVAMLVERNPLKMKAELVERHGFYDYKVRRLLLAAAWGMRPAKIYDGTPSAIAGYVMADVRGALLLYTRAEEDVFGRYLVEHTRLEKGSPEADKFGLLERENVSYYMKLNLHIGLLKR